MTCTPHECIPLQLISDCQVVLVSVPGAFTPGCQAYHIPPYLSNYDKLASKGIDMVIIIASNDAFVMSGWGRVNGVTPESKVYFMSDTKTKFSQQIGWMAGVAEDKVEEALPNLLAAIESEKGGGGIESEGDVGRVRDFLRKVDGGQAVGAEDIKAYFAQLRGDVQASQGGDADADNVVEGDQRREQGGY